MSTETAHGETMELHYPLFPLDFLFIYLFIYLLQAACAPVAPVQEDDIPEVQTLEINCDDITHSDVPLEWSDGEELEESTSSSRMHSTSESPAPLNNPLKNLSSLPAKRQTKKRKSEQYNQAIDMALQMASQQKEKPSYAATIAGTVENLINMCPERSRILAGMRVMQAVHDICSEYINQES